jgi:tocopherol cyclase
MKYSELIRQPLLFQGRNKRKNYFEGWYFKQVDATRQTTLALIPGVSLEQGNRHAFLQVIYSTTAMTHPQTWYVRYPYEAFSFQDHPFVLAIGPNRFSAEGIHLAIEQADLNLKGTVAIASFTPIETSRFSPSIMGPFSFLSFMECYHGVVSMDHVLSGSVLLNQTTIGFDHGRGYLEKDWGKSFPKEYVWLQTNHFATPGTSLMASVAHIPFLGLAFQGFLVNFVHAGKEYRFATYNRSKLFVKEPLGEHGVRLIFKRKGQTLEIEAVASSSVQLAAPKNGVMDHAIKEGLMGEVHVKLTLVNQTLVFDGTGTSAGIEIATLAKQSK